MAKCVIEIEDKPDGGVKVTATPSFEIVCKMVESGGHDLKSSHTYFMHLLRKCMEYSKVKHSDSKILIPRLHMN